MNTALSPRSARPLKRMLVSSIAVAAASAALVVGGTATSAQASPSYTQGCFVITPTTGVTSQTVYAYNTCNRTSTFRVKTVSWYRELCISVAPNTTGGYKWTKGRAFSGVSTPC